jgi:hypothetical protein
MPCAGGLLLRPSVFFLFFFSNIFLGISERMSGEQTPAELKRALESECFRERPPPQRSRRAWAGIFVACQIVPLLPGYSDLDPKSKVIIESFVCLGKWLTMIQVQRRTKAIQLEFGFLFVRIIIFGGIHQEAVSKICLDPIKKLARTLCRTPLHKTIGEVPQA